MLEPFPNLLFTDTLRTLLDNQDPSQKTLPRLKTLQAFCETAGLTLYLRNRDEFTPTNKLYQQIVAQVKKDDNVLTTIQSGRYVIRSPKNRLATIFSELQHWYLTEGQAKLSPK